MTVRKAQNLDKLAIVLSLAVITLVLMAQTIYASGSARVAGAAASGSLSFQVDGATEPADVGGATVSGDVGGGDVGPTDPCDASPVLDDCDEDGDGGGGGVGEATPTDDGPKGDKPVPPGQLKRRGIFGTVSATGTDDNGPYVILATKFGDVTVYTTDAGDFGEGDRFTALLDKSPVPSDATGTTDGSFRTVTALRTKGIPGKASRKHLRSVVVDSASGTDDEGTLTVLDEDGNETVLAGGASGTLDGEDVILLIQQLGEGLPQTVLGGITSFSVGKRLEKLLEKGSPEKLEKLAELIQKRVDKLEERLQRIEDRAPAHLKDKVRGARDKSKGKGRNTGDDGDGGDKGKPDGKGKPDKDKPDKGGGGGKGKPDK